MKILLNVHDGDLKDKYFPPSIIEGLKELGEVYQNSGTEPWTEAQLAENIPGMDICITHWGSPKITPAVLLNAGSLKLVAHCAGSVYNIVCPEVFEKGIKVAGANKVMAKAVAESTLALILASRLKISKYTEMTRTGGWKLGYTHYGEMKTLFGKNVLLVGFGDIGKFVYDLLVPFGTKVTVYDPFIKDDTKDNDPGIIFTDDLDPAVRAADVISLHASQNPGTKSLFSSERIDMIKDGGLLVNTARGSLVDEDYLIKTLETGRINAALDVYWNEPLQPDSPLRDMPNVICLPHVAGASIVLEYAEAMTGEIYRFMNGLPLEYEITAEKAGMMTRE